MITKEFILKSLLPYKLDENKCAVNAYDTCMYLLNGKKCAIGQYMKAGGWQYFTGDIASLIVEYTEDGTKGYSITMSDMFEQEFIDNFHLNVMETMQQYHDKVAVNEYIKANIAIKDIEDTLNITLEELKYDI